LFDDNVGTKPIIDKHYLPYTSDNGIGHRASIGVVALPEDQNIEHEPRMIFDLPGWPVL
jgi:hypothetical protein